MWEKRKKEEQLALWCASGLGRQLLRGSHPRNLDELRRMLPLTSYADYADVFAGIFRAVRGKHGGRCV